MAAENTCEGRGSPELAREAAALCCDSRTKSRCSETPSQGLGPYLRIASCDIGQVYLSSHKTEAELAPAIMAIIKRLRQWGSIQETGAKLPFSQKA